MSASHYCPELRLINKRAVKDRLLALTESRAKRFTRVSAATVERFAISLDQQLRSYAHSAPSKGRTL